MSAQNTDPWSREIQLANLDEAFQAFVQTVRSLTTEAFLSSDSDWSPRDISAHLIGWNHSILAGCKSILQRKEPFYHLDGPNDYHRMNATFLVVFPSTDREELIAEMASSKESLVAFLSGVSKQDWNRETGVVHYRGGPATVARSVDSLIRDYINHKEEILRISPPK